MTADDIEALVPCGPDLASHVAAAKQWIDAGFTHLALVQVGGEQREKFLAWAKGDLLAALRELG